MIFIGKVTTQKVLEALPPIITRLPRTVPPAPACTPFAWGGRAPPPPPRTLAALARAGAARSAAGGGGAWRARGRAVAGGALVAAEEADAERCPRSSAMLVVRERGGARSGG